MLRNALEQSYQVFADVHCPRTLETSPLRDGNEILQALTSALLQNLAGEQIGPYSGWAITTVGNYRDYRHFLPRIFDLAVTEPEWLGTEPPVIAGKLNMGAWRTWPANQQSAVLHVFNAAFDAMIERHPDAWPSDAADWFCGIATLGEEIAPVIERWRTSTAANAALNMAGFINAQSKNMRKLGEVQGSFWEAVNREVRRDVAQLLLEERTLAFLQSASDKVSEEDRFHHLDPVEAQFG
ncbi:hypothetical protein MTsPCn3_23030 [Erythrobacter sp. MTPC3]